MKHTWKIQFKSVKENFQEVIKKKTIRVLIVDDSLSAQKVLKKILEDQKGIEIVGFASSIPEVIEFRKKYRPDVLSLDINMPGKSGLEYLKDIKNTNSIPTVIVTDYNLYDSKPVFEAIDSGAYAFYKKPTIKDKQETRMS